MRLVSLAAGFALFAVAVAPSLARGQGTQSRTSSGLFGSRTTGGGISGLSRGGTSGMGGGSGLGGGGGGGGNLQGADSGQLNGNERFVRGNRQAGDFVGSDTGDLQNFVGGGQGGANRRGGGLGDLGALLSGAQRANQGRDGANGGRTRTPVRTTRIVAFEYSAPPAAQLSTQLTTRLATSERLRMPGVRVEMRGRTAILRGVAITAHDRELAEQLVLLEAGVSLVQNELTVSEEEEDE